MVNIKDHYKWFQISVNPLTMVCGGVFLFRGKGLQLITLWESNIAFKQGPFIIDLPSKDGDFP